MGGTFGVLLALHHQDGCQRLKSLFASHLRTRAALGLVWQIDVLERCRVPTVVNAFLQVGRHLLQFRNGLDDGGLSLGYLLQLLQPVADGRNLYLVQSPCPLLAVT